MKPELRERLERLGPIRDVDRENFGYPVDLVLRPRNGLAKVRTIELIRVLARHRMTLLRAKRAVEAMVEHGEVYVRLPFVESEADLAIELTEAGATGTKVQSGPINVRELRQRLAMTQEVFSRRFQVPIGVLRNWEQGLSSPDATANAYLRVISSLPVETAVALETPLPDPD